MNEQQATVQSRDGRSVFYRCLAPSAAKAGILLVHGMGEHSGRYGWVMSRLAEAGFAVYAADYYGHGRSVPPGGVLADLRSVGKALEDLRCVHETALQKHQGLPWFLLGHSLGGTLSILYALQHPAELRGLVLSAAAVSLPAYVSPLLLKISAVLARLLPRLPIQSFDYLTLSRRPEVIEALLQDPLYYKGKVRARTGYQLLRAFSEAGRRLGELRLPVLCLQGGADTQVDRGDAQRVYDGASSADKSVRIFPGLYHEILNEPEREQVLEVILDWLRRHLA